MIGVDSIVLHVCPYTFIRYSAYCMQFPGNVARDELRVKCIENNTHSPDFNFDNELEFIDCSEIEKSGTSVEDIGKKKWFYTKTKLNSRQK